MEYYQLLAGLALAQLGEDTGSGPPPPVSDLEADRRAGRVAPARRARRAAADAAAEPAAVAPRPRRWRGRFRRANPAVAA